LALDWQSSAQGWTAESASYTPSDETITQANLGSHKSTSKIIVSEELRRHSAVELDAYLAFELGGRLGALQETAFTVGDGSGKPLGLVHASSPYTVVNAATGSSTSYKLADLVTVYKALPAAYRANATWLVTPTTSARSLASPKAPVGSFFPRSSSTRRTCSDARCSSAPSARPGGLGQEPRLRTGSAPMQCAG
jgi:HK97 family phage major capsid protein